jgi:TRAP-type C4-dicarboxylate transport system substrate-binding protein
MKRLKKCLGLTLVLAVSSAAVALFGWVILDPAPVVFASEAKPITLKFAENAPPVSMYCKSRMWWAGEIEKRSGGRLKIKIFPGGSLAKDKVVIDAVKARLADGGLVPTVYHPGKTPLGAVSQNPVGSSDLYASYMAQQYLMNNYAPLQKELEKVNQKALWASGPGAMRLMATTPVDSLDKLKGLKIRASGQFADLVKRLGATPVFIPTGETYEGLQRGTAQGLVHGLAFIGPHRFFEVCKHLMMFEDIGASVLGLGTINLDVWNGLPADIQNVVQEVSNEYAIYLAKAQIELEENILKKFRAAGVTIYRMSAEDKRKLQTTAKAVAGQWTEKIDAKGLPGTEILGLFVEMKAKYQAEVDTKGYPWAR